MSPELEMIISRCRFAVEQRRRSKAGDERQLWVDCGRFHRWARMARTGGKRSPDGATILDAELRIGEFTWNDMAAGRLWSQITIRHGRRPSSRSARACIPLSVPLC